MLEVPTRHSDHHNDKTWPSFIGMLKSFHPHHRYHLHRHSHQNCQVPLSLYLSVLFINLMSRKTFQALEIAVQSTSRLRERGEGGDNACGVDCERTSCLFPLQPHPPNNSKRLSAVFYSVFILPVFHLFIVKFYHFLFRPDHTLSIACLDLVFIASQLDLTHIKAQLAE